MGKQGPCCHCGTTSTPLWRNGPPGKPVLCNACGSRWRTRGTLENYTPLHARTSQPLDTEDSNDTTECKVPLKTKTENLCMKANNVVDMERQEKFAGYDLCPTDFEGDTSNKSSSGSAISCTDCYAQLGSIGGNEMSGSVQFNFLDSNIPSKKRSRKRHRSPSTVEKLGRSLLDILQEQEPSSLAASEEVLIFGKEDLSYPAEIGLGCVLLNSPESVTMEASEASSLVTENNAFGLNSGCVESLFLQSKSSEFSNSKKSDRLIQETGGAEELKVNIAKQKTLRNKYSGNTLHSNPDILQNTHSSHMQKYWKSQNVESFIPKDKVPEITSCSSRLIGGGIPLPAKRNPDLPCLPTSGGPSFDTIEGFKKPKEQILLQNPPSSTSCPPMTQFRVKTSDKDIQMRAHPGNNFPVGRFPSTSDLQKEANDRETKSVAETNHTQTTET